MKRTAIQKELQKIAKKHKGILKPIDVVKEAEDTNSILHNCFEWNKNKAAHEYRLWQARQLITSYRIRIIEADEKPSKFYVSLKQDRYKGTGYRSLQIVLSQPKLRELLLQDAFEEFNYFREKYGKLKELKRVFEEMEKVQKRKKKRNK